MPENVLEEPVTHQVISDIRIPNLSDAAKNAVVERKGFLTKYYGKMLYVMQILL